MQPAPGTHHPRRRRHIDWELIACGVRGHAVRRTSVPRASADRLSSARGTARAFTAACAVTAGWRSTPRGAGPAHPPERDEIVIPLRGKALRDRVVLRLIAVDRAFHFTILVLLGVGVLAFAGNEHSLRDAYYRVLTALQGGVAGGPVQTTGHVGILHELDRLFTLRSGTLHEVAIGLLAYGLLEGIEAVGLWYGRRWAEYLTFLATTILLPLEIYELAHRQRR